MKLMAFPVLASVVAVLTCNEFLSPMETKDKQQNKVLETTLKFHCSRQWGDIFGFCSKNNPFFIFHQARACGFI